MNAVIRASSMADRQAARQRRLDAIGAEGHDAQPDTGRVEDGIRQRRRDGRRGGLADPEGWIVERPAYLAHGEGGGMPAAGVALVLPGGRAGAPRPGDSK